MASRSRGDAGVPIDFLPEIKIAAGLSHPHILPVHDSGEAEGFLYHFMPNVQGETFRDRLNREGQPPIDDALQLTREIADALGSAHGHAVVTVISSQKHLAGRSARSHC